MIFRPKTVRRVLRNGSIRYSKNGLIHREDGPAMIDPDGSELWYFNGKPYNPDGPIYITPEGRQYFDIGDGPYVYVG